MQTSGGTGGFSGRRLVFAMALVAVAGSVDAVGYLHFAEVFVSFMSGNTTVLAIDLGAARWADAGPVVLALAAFVLGAFGGSLVGEGLPHVRIPLLLAAEALLLGLALLLPEHGSKLFAIPLIAAAMGGQNAVLHKVGDANVSLTFVTGTLVRFARALADAVLGREGGHLWPVYGALWIALAVGAVCGAVLHATLGLGALVAPAAALAIMAVVAVVMMRD